MISQLVVFSLFDAFVCLSKIDTLYELFRKTVTFRLFTSEKRKENRWRHHTYTTYIVISFDIARSPEFGRKFHKYFVMGEPIQLLQIIAKTSNVLLFSLNDDQTLPLRTKPRRGQQRSDLVQFDGQMFDEFSLSFRIATCPFSKAMPFAFSSSKHI